MVTSQVTESTQDGLSVGNKFKQTVLDRSMGHLCAVVLSTTYYVASVNVPMRCTITWYILCVPPNRSFVMQQALIRTSLSCSPVVKPYSH